MPVWGNVLTEEQLNALVAYTLSAAQGTSIEAGQQAYLQNCAACHGEFGEGGSNPSRAGDIIFPISTGEYLKTRDDFSLALKAQQKILADIAEVVRLRFPKVEIKIAVEESYRNMLFVLEQHPQVVERALEAARRAGLQPSLSLIRGGTDGARLCYMGLPTPNIFTGGHLFHSRFEWIAIEGMLSAVETLVQLVQVWVEKSK